MIEFTGGPWTLGKGKVRVRTENENKYKRHVLICECYTTQNSGRYPKEEEEREANAKLIAAAPDMFEVILDIYRGDVVNLHKISEIINKVL